MPGSPSPAPSPGRQPGPGEETLCDACGQMTVTARDGVCPGCWAMKDPSRTPILGGTRRGRGGGFLEHEPDLLELLSTAAATLGPPAVLALLVAYLLFFL